MMSELENTPLYMFSGYRRAFERMTSFARLGRPGFISFCIGAGGAGKSRLSRLVGPEAFGAEGRWPRGMTPFIRVSADTRDRGYFSSKSFAQTCLREIGDPFLAQPSDALGKGLSEKAKRALSRHASLRQPNVSEPQLRDRFMGIAKVRSLKLLVVDEANLLVMTQKGRRPTDYLESLRMIGEQVGCAIALFGSFDLLRLLDYSAQVNRRSYLVHLERMNCRDDKGKGEFVEFLRCVESDRGLKAGLLSDRPGATFEWTYGIPGEVDGLITRAVSDAKGEIGQVTREILEGARPLPRITKRMREEADFIAKMMEHESPASSPARSVEAGHSVAQSGPRMSPKRREVGVHA